MPGNNGHSEASGGRRIDRRSFVKAAGASGIAVGIAGCIGGGGGGGGGGKIPTEPPSGDVTVQVAADSNFKNSQSKIQTSLVENGGMPDNITVQFQAGSFTTGDRRAKYQQLLNANQQQPAVMMMDNGWTIPFIARNQIMNLSKALPSSIVDTVKSEYLNTMVATATAQNGDLHGIPLFADFPTIQYRKDLMREAGYSDSDFKKWATEPMKWQKFSEIVKQTQEQTDTEQGFNWQGAAYIGLSCCDFVEFMGSWGGSYFGAFENLFGPIGDRPITVDEQQVINAIRMMRTFIYGSADSAALEGYKQISPQEVVSYKEESSRKPFTNGNAVALRNWPYSININAASDAFGTDLGTMPVPFHTSASESKYGPEIGGSTSALGGWHLCLNPNAPEKKLRAALQLFKALQKDQVRLDLFEIGGWIPPIPELIDTERSRKLEPIGRYTDTLKVAGQNAVPRPVTRVWPQQSNQVAKEVNGSLRQQKSPSEAMSSLKESLKSIEQQNA